MERRKEVKFMTERHVHSTQADAIARAKEIVHSAGGGEVRIHGRDGSIRDSVTVSPGNDPCPPKDKR
jgi:hypothetical protein